MFFVHYFYFTFTTHNLCKVDTCPVTINKYIKTVAGKTIVTVKDAQSSKYVDKEIQIGIRGDDGLIEILSGLSEGDMVKSIGK